MKPLDVQAADTFLLAEKWRARNVPSFPLAISWDEGKGKTNKRPLTEHGFLDATTDVETFKAQLKAAMGKIKPGEVLALGLHPGPAGFVVFDGDLQDGKGNKVDGVGFMRTELKLPPYSLTIKTASGGIHRWLRKRDLTVKISNAHPWPDVGLDIRSDSGYVVAPGVETPWGEWTEYDEPGWDVIELVPEDAGTHSSTVNPVDPVAVAPAPGRATCQNSTMPVCTLPPSRRCGG